VGFDLGDQAEPELVLIHGGAQNAHTWDTVALALNRPLVAIDLPGHGHSAWREDGRYDPVTLAEEIAGPLAAWAPKARMVVGMSLGGLTAMTLAADWSALVPSLVMVDITPGVNQTKAKAVIDFVAGPQSFASFEDLVGSDHRAQSNAFRVLVAAGDLAQCTSTRRWFLAVAL
jgi:pimeloyl-ACP methyl ester carboxylesterase